jgi:ATP-binding cassette subfamily B protein
MAFSIYKQLDAMDCGPTCLRMVAKHYGKAFNLRTLSKLCGFSRDGISLLGLSDGAEKIHFKPTGVRLNTYSLTKTNLPCILYWRKYHFVVLYKIRNGKFYIADPALGSLALNEREFEENWINDINNDTGIALLLTPTPQFYGQSFDANDAVKWTSLLKYFVQYRRLFLQLLIGLGLGCLVQLIVPFLTQSLVDIGINTHNLNFIYVILFAQAMLIAGRVTVEFIRAWLLLHISTRVNISILTDFLIKLMKLPMSFFDTKMTGDILQRVNDQKRIESFLTGSALTTAFSLFNLVIFSAILIYYNLVIFLVFVVSSTLYVGWIVLFMDKRKVLNYKNFEIGAKNQGALMQLINGMQEIKLNNCERQMRWEWEHVQARLFKFSTRSLALSQYQQGGSTLLVEGSFLFITFLSAKSVLEGQLTLGAMMALQYIIGQLSAPIQQLLTFMQAYQDAKLSMERLNEIHCMDDEEPENKGLLEILPDNKSIKITNVTFRYPGAGNEPVLKNLNLYIPAGTTTAIVGVSGSGKTTLLRLMLRFYDFENGEIAVDCRPLSAFSYNVWRANCGVVMQDGFIFSDTIEKNIAVGDDNPDGRKLRHAIDVANIRDFINELPLGLNTKIGAEGNGISQGQRQRILIARAVYKNPQYIFFDEATNALDANNEQMIMENLEAFFSGRTVVVVAHRLSTVRNADNIVVLSKGVIVEQGTHYELTSLRGTYYNLVKNQLELGAD